MASSSDQSVPIACESKRRNKTRPLYPVDFVDLIFQREGNPFLFGADAEAGEKPLAHHLWWHAGHLINQILKEGCTPKFILAYFAPFINRETRACILVPATRSLLAFLQYKWSLVCSTVASDLLASAEGELLSDETVHLRRLFRLRRTTMHQLTGAVYEVLGWVARHSGMRKQAELLWQCGADSGHPGCLVWLALEINPDPGAPHRCVYRDPRREIEEALRFIHAAHSLNRPVPYQDSYLALIQRALKQYEGPPAPTEDDPVPQDEE